MAEYYLISQLPSLDGISESTPLPITQERFTELCQRFLGKKAQREFEKLTLAPSRNPEKSSSALIEEWNEGERKLRLALAKLRADKMNKQFDAGNQSFSPTLLQAARTAIESESPMEAEKLLNRYRLDFLETLRPMDSFSEEYVFYYGLKLKLIERIRKFDTESGESAYRNIYSSIMNGERSEVIQ
ncbi:MAG: DUF2764 family protein [Acutalibacteraceae bacterium]|nr:DUF2764 family protein [Acutalibacteraceae bacterium]